MSLYRVSPDNLEPVSRTTFAAEGLMERQDLQRLLRNDISPIGTDLMVIAEEFGDWEDSNRRIDLLCLSEKSELVVVEIKRTEDGGHMELQAVRYAAMVSSMTLEQAISTYARTIGDADTARNDVLEFLQVDSVDKAVLTGRVRIVLVSADFSTEVTTTVLWLNKHELDITCIRLTPYRLRDEVLIDTTKIIPLLEAADYEVRLRPQEIERRRVTGARQELFRRFWSQLIARSRPLTQLLANRTTSADSWIRVGVGRTGFGLNLVLNRYASQVECYFRLAGGEENSNAVFGLLLAQKTHIENAFGGPLDWQELPGRQGCRICTQLPGGWSSPETDWPEIQDRMIDALIRLDSALREPIQQLNY